MAILSDPRLPDSSAPDAIKRIYGDKRPKVHPPFMARKLAEGKFGFTEYRVTSNRKGTRFWLEVLAQGFLLDYLTTTSKKKADGWIAAINDALKRGDS